VLSRRGLIRALSATAIAGLPGFGSITFKRRPGWIATISDGYTDRQSYRPGDRVTLFLNAKFPQYAIVPLYDYTGRIVHTFGANLFPQQPLGPTPWETGFGYQQSVSFTLPIGLRSGVYLADGMIPVIVKDPALAHADLVVLYPTNTIAAYNGAGGKSLYSAPEPSPIVSFERPVGLPPNLAFFSAFLEWFASIRLPYSIRYIADVDLEEYAAIGGASLLVVIGHSEYWTRGARENFDQFVLGGGRALLLSGNNMWWQARYSDDRSQLICYKRAPDPITDPLFKTVNWTNRLLNYPILRSVGADFIHGGFGAASNKSTGFRVLSPKSPVFRGLYVPSNEVFSMPTVEYDGAPLLNNPVTNGEPRLDLDALDAYRAEIIGYEYCAKTDVTGEASSTGEGVGTWLAYQRTATSGVVMNGASTNWCSRTGAFGQDGFRVRKIILNMMDILANRQTVFAT